MSGIQLVNVSKRFGETYAVRGLNLDIRAGEFVSIVGGSGCGKTTTLRLIAGFESPTQGEIRIGGQPVQDLPVHARGVGIVFQSYALFPTMSVAQNVGFGLEMARKKPAERVARVKEVLELVHLQELAERFPWQLSGGQQQRVALARALAVAPQVLLLDEPLSALDARIRLTLRSEIRRIQQTLGITVVYVTHDQEEALAIADRMVVMEKGEVQQAGSAIQVYDRPENAFVAGFVGISNLFRGSWEGPQEGWVGGQRWKLPAPGHAVAPGQSLLVAVRPERLKLWIDEAPPEGHNWLEGRLGVRTFLGSSWRVELMVGEETVLVDLPRDEDHRLARLPLGQQARASFRPEDCVVIG